jgi:hypothetical protein
MREPHRLLPEVKTRPGAHQNFARSTCRFVSAGFVAQKLKRCELKGGAPLFLKLTPFAADLSQMLYVTVN